MYIILNAELFLLYKRRYFIVWTWLTTKLCKVWFGVIILV